MLFEVVKNSKFVSFKHYFLTFSDSFHISFFNLKVTTFS